jgi:outer membrane protein assembly factor BamB
LLLQLTNQGKADKIVRTFQVRYLRQETYSRLERGGNMFNPRERSRPIAFLAFLLIAYFLLCGIASATPSITLSKKSGPPTSRILVSGRGFKPNVGVDIFFDTKDKALVVTNGRGEFHDARIHAPRSARPGKHWVTALERNNDKGAQEPFLVQTDWAQFYFTPDHDGLNPYENVLNPRTVRSLQLEWSFATGHGGVISSPAVVSGVVYVGSFDNNVYALDARTGAKLWSYTTGAGVYSSPAVADGVVYVGSFDNNVYALDARTGAKLWSYTTGRIVESSPAVADGVVYVGSYDDNVYALNARTGAKLWNYATGYPVTGSPAVANGVVYAGSNDGNLYALNAHTGAKLWSYFAGGYDVGTPTVGDGIVYAVVAEEIFAVNAITGTLLWTYTTGSVVRGSATVARGVVYVGSDDSNVYAFDAQTGAKLWSHTTGGEVETAPAVANGVVYVGAFDNNVYALKARNGALLWTYLTGDWVQSSPAIVNGVIYVGSNDSNVYALGLKHDAEQAGEDSKRPDTKTLRQDFNLKVSKSG